MKTRSSVHHTRNDTHGSAAGSWLGAAVALAFAAAPLVVLLWAVPITGIGIA